MRLTSCSCDGIAGVLGAPAGVSGAGVSGTAILLAEASLAMRSSCNRMRNLSWQASEWVRHALGNTVTTLTPNRFTILNCTFQSHIRFTFANGWRRGLAFERQGFSLGNGWQFDWEGWNRFNLATDASYRGKINFPSDGSTNSVVYTWKGRPNPFDFERGFS